MKTLILAAGIGQRLGGAGDNRPKCLLEFNGRSLLSRHLDILRHYAVSEIIIVTGYEAEMIREAISQAGAEDIVRTVNNPEYRKGSNISLLAGLESLDTDEDFILMDADVLYDQRMIERLLQTDHKNCFLLDQDFIPGEEPVKLCVRNGMIVEFRKKIDPQLEFDLQGESVGFFRFTADTASKLICVTRDYLNQGKDQQPYEECIRDLLLETPGDFGYEDVTGLRWIEIDFPEDVERAKSDILPQIMQIN